MEEIGAQDVAAEAPTEISELRALVARLGEDARAYAVAEADVVREITAVRARAARGGMLMVIAGVSLATAAAVALVLGILLTVAQSVGPLWATVIVVGVTMVVSGALGWLGWGRVKQAFKGKL